MLKNHELHELRVWTSDYCHFMGLRLEVKHGDDDKALNQIA